MVVLFRFRSYIITGRFCRLATERKCDERHRSYDCFGARHNRSGNPVLLRLAREKCVPGHAKNAVGNRGDARVFVGILWMVVV